MKQIARDQMAVSAYPSLMAGTSDYWRARLAGWWLRPSPELVSQAHALLSAPVHLRDEIGFNLPAFLIALVVTTVLAIGIKESAKFNATIVVVKVAVVLFVLGLGVEVCATTATGAMTGTALRRMDLAGSGLAAAYIFFAYIGFDAVSTTAQEAKNPQRDLPIGIIASLSICTLLYIGVAAY